jgi:hypothetical protein
LPLNGQWRAGMQHGHWHNPGEGPTLRPHERAVNREAYSAAGNRAACSAVLTACSFSRSSRMS